MLSASEPKRPDSQSPAMAVSVAPQKPRVHDTAGLAGPDMNAVRRRASPLQVLWRAVLETWRPNRSGMPQGAVMGYCAEASADGSCRSGRLGSWPIKGVKTWSEAKDRCRARCAAAPAYPMRGRRPANTQDSIATV